MKRKDGSRGGPCGRWCDGRWMLAFALMTVVSATPLAGQRTTTGPQVTRVIPERVEIVPGGRDVEILLEGVGLAAFRSLVVESRGRVVRGIRTDASPDRRGERVQLVLLADESAAGLRVDLVLTDGKTRIPISGVEVSVADLPPPPPPAFTPLSWAADGMSMIGRRFEAKSFSADGMSMTGRRFEPITFGTNDLSMTGRRFAPVRVSTPPISMTGRRPNGGTS